MEKRKKFEKLFKKREKEKNNFVFYKTFLFLCIQNMSCITFIKSRRIKCFLKVTKKNSIKMKKREMKK